MATDALEWFSRNESTERTSWLCTAVMKYSEAWNADIDIT